MDSCVDSCDAHHVLGADGQKEPTSGGTLCIDRPARFRGPESALAYGMNAVHG